MLGTWRVTLLVSLDFVCLKFFIVKIKLNVSYQTMCVVDGVGKVGCIENQEKLNEFFSYTQRNFLLFIADGIHSNSTTSFVFSKFLPLENQSSYFHILISDVTLITCAADIHYMCHLDFVQEHKLNYFTKLLGNCTNKDFRSLVSSLLANVTDLLF